MQATEDQTVSEVFLNEVERFASYVGDAIVNVQIDTGDVTEITLPERNIGMCKKNFNRLFFTMYVCTVLDATAIPSIRSEIEDIIFPGLDEIKVTSCDSADVKSRIPAGLLIERNALGR